MNRLIISQLIKQIVLSIIFTLILGTVFASVFASNEEPTSSDNNCLECHDDLWQEEMAKRYVHAPFREKKCKLCHAINALPNRDVSENGVPERWAEKNLIAATSHWFELDAPDNPTIMILEAAYASVARVYKEIPIPPLNDLSSLADVYKQEPPKISNVKILEVTKGVFLTARISWQTDRPTSSVVTYGIGELHQTTPLNGRLHTEHIETLNILQKGQTYQFRITAEDTIGNRTDSKIFELHTANTFSNKDKEIINKNCCLAVPLGIESNFYRDGDKLIVNITGIRPIKVIVSFINNDHIKTGDSKSPETTEKQPQENKHIITNEQEKTTFIVCKSCHRTSASHHPVNVYPKKSMKIPGEYSTMNDGRISCTSCHSPHASNLDFRMFKDHRQELCIDCHNKST